MTAAIRTRRPSGVVPWPLVLVEGPEKSGKTWACAEFTACERIGTTYWLDLGEGAADEYAAIPGASYEVIVHDGTWPDILGQVQAVHAEALRAAHAGEKPVVLVVDSMTAEWDLLKDWVTMRARTSPKGRQALAKDPDAEIKAPMNLWNDANDRHSRLMHLLMTFTGIVLVTARGKEVASLDDNGRPIPNTKEHKVEGHKNLAYDCSAWVQLSRENHPRVVGVRSVHAGIRPGVDKPKLVPNFSIEWLVFEHLGCDPAGATIRDHVRPQPVDYPPLTDDEVDTILAELDTADTLDSVSTIGRRLGKRVEVSPRGGEIIAAATARKTALSSPSQEAMNV